MKRDETNEVENKKKWKNKVRDKKEWKEWRVKVKTKMGQKEQKE